MNLFISHHIEELAAEYLGQNCNIATPVAAQVLDILVQKPSMDDEEDASEMMDFTLPGVSPITLFLSNSTKTAMLQKSRWKAERLQSSKPCCFKCWDYGDTNYSFILVTGSENSADQVLILVNCCFAKATAYVREVKSYHARLKR